MSERETTVETWLYAGQRFAEAKRKTYYVWVDERGEELHFTKTSGGMAGGSYAVDVIRRDDGLSIVGSPRYLAEQGARHATPSQLDTWRAEDRAARQRVEDLRAEKNAPLDDELEQALEVIRRHYAKLHTMAKRGAFSSYLLGEMTRSPRKDPA